MGIVVVHLSTSLSWFNVSLYIKVAIFSVILWSFPYTHTLCKWMLILTHLWKNCIVQCGWPCNICKWVTKYALFLWDDLAIHASISISTFKWCILNLMKGRWKKGGKKNLKETYQTIKKTLRKQLNNESTYGTTLGIFVLSI